MKLYLSIVQNDWANKSSSAPRHLTSVDKVLQFANLHGALKPSGQRCSSVHRAHSHTPFTKAATHTLCCNPQPFCLGTSLEASKQRDLSLTIASAAVRHVQRLFCLLSLGSPAAQYLTAIGAGDPTVCRSLTCGSLMKHYQSKAVTTKIHILLSSPVPLHHKAAQHYHQTEFTIRAKILQGKINKIGNERLNAP